MSAVSLIQAAPKITHIQDAYEALRIDVFISSTGDGSVRIYECSDCDPIKMKVTSQTKGTVAGQQYPLVATEQHFGQAGTVIFDLESQQVATIIWQP